MVLRPRSSDIAVSTECGLLNARYAMSCRDGMRLPSSPMLRNARSRAWASGDRRLIRSCSLLESALLEPVPWEPLRPRPFIVLNVLDVVRQERRQVGQLVQGRHAKTFQEVAGGAVQDLSLIHI